MRLIVAGDGCGPLFMVEPATVGVSVVFVVVLLAVVSSLEGASLLGAEFRVAPRKAEVESLAAEEKGSEQFKVTSLSRSPHLTKKHPV